MVSTVVARYDGKLALGASALLVKTSDKDQGRKSR